MNELLAEQYAVRGRLVADLERDLMGPVEDLESITDPPITRYLTGVLYPQSTEPLDETLLTDEQEDYDESSVPDPAVSLANVRYPASMGISFAVDAARATTIAVRIQAATYARRDAPEEDEGGSAEGHGDGRWQRSPLTATMSVPIVDTTERRAVPGFGGLELYVRIRGQRDGSRAVTLALINTRVATKGSTQKDADSYFQVALHVRLPGAGGGGFVERGDWRASEDRDLQSYALLYRHAGIYAVGHGCSATWSVGQEGEDWVASTFVPQHELKLMVSNPALDLDALSLGLLAHGDRESVCRSLAALPGAYNDWIALRRNEPLATTYRETAERHLKDCADAADRMLDGIRLLEDDPDAWEAFTLANKAMLIVRSRTDWHRRGRPEVGPDEDGQQWRPFQLGFILMCLRGIANPDHSDRSVVDLLWFPTGGGKTEAYLGLIAFTLFYRRLRRGVDGAGVTALMRYTLRLLTIQQFERAAALICACEILRREHPRLTSGAPVSLGLWVGGDGTPNDRRRADLALSKIRAGIDVPTGNPVQLRQCPWCAHDLDGRNYYLRDDKKQIVIACRAKSCPFSAELPVFVVDEDVYDFHPTLVVATADKFAGIAWRDQAHRLFNLDKPGTPPPELIIQDELHLISGPLGTLAGLYEAAIDIASRAAGRPAKVVASTATIRRADDQSASLFAREVLQFPPPGIDARNSFFAVEADRDEVGTRLYTGLMAPGSSHTTLLVRVYARLLQSAMEVDSSEEAVDPYWTLVGYFNSLRVLGGARMQVHNDVVDRLKQITPAGSAERDVDKVIELTSRASSSEIPQHLKQLGERLPSADTLDVVLATNMISVGVDIDRLGLMAVMGQPQGTSEYIQATSRVGRKYPGLVVDLLNAARSRDRSHYESFIAYHGALYRQVESTSVTPFSPRARDRALHAVLIALARLTIPGLRDNQAAAQIERYLPEVLALKNELLARVLQIDKEQVEAVDAELDAVIAAWRARAVAVPNLRYRGDDTTVTLLKNAGEKGDTDALPTLWSLRDVDSASNLYLLGSLR